MKRILWAGLFCLLILGGCSTAPRAPDGVFDRRNEAARLCDMGSASLLKGAYSEAWWFYAEACRIYTAVDDAPGRFIALEGASRAATADPSAPMSKIGAVEGWGLPPVKAEDAQTLAIQVAEKDGSPLLLARAMRFKAELALAGGAFSGAATLASEAAASFKKDKKRAVEYAAARRVQAESLKGAGSYEDALALLSELYKLDKKAKRFADLASDHFLAASILSKSGDYVAAEQALLEALDADRKSENPSGIASDLLALGIVAQKRGDFTEAARRYAEARDVFAAAKLEDAAKDAEERRKAVAP